VYDQTAETNFSNAVGTQQQRGLSGRDGLPIPGGPDELDEDQYLVPARVQDFDPAYSDVASAERLDEDQYLVPAPGGNNLYASGVQDFDPTYSDVADVDSPKLIPGGDALYADVEEVGASDSLYYSDIPDGPSNDRSSPKRRGGGGAAASYKAGNAPTYSYVEQTYLVPVAICKANIQGGVVAGGGGAGSENMYTEPVALPMQARGGGGAAAAGGVAGGVAVYEYSEVQTQLDGHTYALAINALDDDQAGHTYALASNEPAESPTVVGERAATENTFC